MIEDSTFGLLYTAQATIYFVFAGACLWRAWENHLAHHAIRKALLAMAGLFLFLGGTGAFRVWGRLYNVNDRWMLSSPGYFWIQVAATISLIVLFFVLQAPRKDIEYDEAMAAKQLTELAAKVAEKLIRTAEATATAAEKPELTE
jgi:hypothetical protein